MLQAVLFQVHRKMLNELFCPHTGLGGKLIIQVEGIVLHYPYSLV
jgi:hypothetical protein